MSDIKKINVENVARGIFNVDPIILNETCFSRTLFFATLNEEGVHGKIVYEKKDANGDWVFAKDLDKTMVRKGQWMAVDLKTAELLNIVSYLESLKEFKQNQNIFSFNHYIFVDSMRGIPEEDIKELNKVFSDGSTLLKSIAQLSRDGKIDLINKLNIKNGIDTKDIGDLLEHLDKTQIEETKLKLNITELNNSINELKTMIANESPESDFQNFFDKNRNILTIAIPSLISVINSQPYCGGKDINGNGGSYGDFLCKESNNTAFIEIKTPSCKIVLNDLNRNGINKISNDIINAVVQVKYQKDQFYKVWAGDSLYKESFFDASCFIIAGRNNDFDCQEKINAFEIFKKSLNNVTIITYDDLIAMLEKIKAIMME